MVVILNVMDLQFQLLFSVHAAAHQHNKIAANYFIFNQYEKDLKYVFRHKTIYLGTKLQPKFTICLK